MLDDLNAGRFILTLSNEAPIGDQSGLVAANNERSGFSGEPRQVIPVRRMSYDQGIDLPRGKRLAQSGLSFRVSSWHKKIEEALASPIVRKLAKFVRSRN